MKRKLFTPLSMGAMALALVMVACGKAPQLTRDNVDDVLAHMTLDEKINIVVGAGNETFTGYGNTKKLVPGAAGTTSPIPRLGIPPTALTDGATTTPASPSAPPLPRRGTSPSSMRWERPSATRPMNTGSTSSSARA